MLKSPYGKNWEASSFYAIYCVATHAKTPYIVTCPFVTALKSLGVKSISVQVRFRARKRAPRASAFLRALREELTVRASEAQGVSGTTNEA